MSENAAQAHETEIQRLKDRLSRCQQYVILAAIITVLQFGIMIHAMSQANWMR